MSSRFRKIDLTKPSSNEVLEFKRLTGTLPLYEDIFDKKKQEELDISDDQLDPEDQLDPDDADERDSKENAIRKVVDYDGKEVWSGQKPTKKSKKSIKK